MENTSPVNIAEKLSQVHDHWHPRIVAALNGQHVKVAKLLGEFDWHAHDEEDEMFLVIEGELRLELKDQTAVTLRPGEFYVVPRGVPHKPCAAKEVSILLFEPATTVNTGDSPSDRTKNDLEWI